MLYLLKASFKTLKNWVEELQSQGPKGGLALAIAGNKCDLENKREVARETAETYAKEINASFLETSAKDNTNILDIFVRLTQQLPDHTQGSKTGSTIRPKASDQGAKKGGCC